MTRLPVPARVLPRLLAPLVSALFAPGTAFAQEVTERAQPVFVDGQAQVVDAFKDSKEWIHEELWVETGFDSDGDGKPDRMHVDVTRQKQTQTEGLKVPVIYETSPYFSGVGGEGKQFNWDPRHEIGAVPPPHESPSIKFLQKHPLISPSEIRTWVPRGFAVVHSESPGTGLSQGCPTVGGENERQAPRAVIDWLCGRAKGYTTIDGNETIEAKWCSGHVGMTGTSYNGTLPLAAATTGVEGLDAIIPISPNTAYYNYYRSNGLVRHPGGYMGEDVDVLYDFINSGNPDRREWCNENVRDKILKAKADRLTGDYSDFWAERDYLNLLAPLHAATLMAHGFNDWNVMPEHSVRIYAELKKKGVPCMAYFHQGGHGGPPPLKLMNRWFTRYLYGVDNGIEKDPRAWIVRENDREPTPYADYPVPGTSPVAVHPRGDGNKVGDLRIDPAAGKQTEKLVDDTDITGAKLAAAEASEHRLLFATPALKEPLHLSGTAKIKIRLAASKPAANLSVWLVELPWNEDPRTHINDNLITRGWADPQNSKSLRQSAPLVPGQFYELQFDLQPDDQIIAVGKRIALMIFSSDHDFTLWPPAGTVLTVDLDATSLELPVVGGLAAYSKATVESKGAGK